MSVFFNPSTDQALLHSSVRNSDELSTIVDQVEWEILNAYSQRDMEAIGTYEAFFEYEFGRDPTDEIKVRLFGYNADDPANSEAGLKEALKRTIALVVSKLLRNYDNQDNVQSIQQGKRSVTYAGMVPTYTSFPTGWDRFLKNYDARYSSYGI